MERTGAQTTGPRTLWETQARTTPGICQSAIWPGSPLFRGFRVLNSLSACGELFRLGLARRLPEPCAFAPDSRLLRTHDELPTTSFSMRTAAALNSAVPDFGSVASMVS